jgi:ABC-type phosphate transport system auxiliary subunit
MRLWQRRAHPWIWLAVAAMVAFVLIALVQNEPGLLNLN